MGLTVCPSAVVATPVEVVWENLVQWERYSKWFSADLQVERIEPEGPATIGQTINFGGKALGRTWRLDPCHCCTLPASAPSHPGDHRPSFLSPQI
jgi:hypothetical protein